MRAIFGLGFTLGLLPLIACSSAPDADGAASSSPDREAVNATDHPVAATNPKPRHCVSSPTDEVTCYATFTEAIAAATGGRIADAPADPRDAIHDPTFADRINAIATEHAAAAKQAEALGQILLLEPLVIGIDYIDANYGGNTWVWERYAPCNGDLTTPTYYINNLNEEPTWDFNDSISSFHSYSNCQTVLYENWYWEGAATNGGVPIVDMSYVGNAMNDKASSIRWY